MELNIVQTNAELYSIKSVMYDMFTCINIVYIRNQLFSLREERGNGNGVMGHDWPMLPTEGLKRGVGRGKSREKQVEHWLGIN